MSRRAPRKINLAVESLVAKIAPTTTLGSVQRIWAQTVGSAVAAAATPVSERDGVLTVACKESVWAAELDLMGPEIVMSLNEALGADSIVTLRCRTTAT